jgi:hypothetical protein
MTAHRRESDDLLIRNRFGHAVTDVKADGEQTAIERKTLVEHCRLSPYPETQKTSVYRFLADLALERTASVSSRRSKTRATS